MLSEPNLALNCKGRCVAQINVGLPQFRKSQGKHICCPRICFGRSVKMKSQLNDESRIFFNPLSGNPVRVLGCHYLPVAPSL